MNTQIDKSLTSNIQHDATIPISGPKVEKVSALEQAKAEMNVSIMQSAKVTIGAKNESLTLLFNAAIDKINEQLAPSLGENAIKKSANEGLDISPEATAERIVSLSTRSYQAYKANHSNESEETVLNDYIALISKGVDQGFGEARSILDGLDVLEGDIASNISKTYELVQDKLMAFKSLMSEQTAALSEEIDKP